jgi:hypothetical protein
MITTCFCTNAILNGTALAYIVTLTTKKEDDATISVSHGTNEPDSELVAADWPRVRSLLPLPEHLDALLNQRYGTFVYDSAVSRWRQ